MRGSTTLAPVSAFVNTGVSAVLYPLDLPLTRHIRQAPYRGLRLPVISANQVTRWAALRRLGTRAVGPYRALTPAARTGPVPPGPGPGAALPELPEDRQQEGWS
jgi:maleate isomerase